MSLFWVALLLTLVLTGMRFRKILGPSLAKGSGNEVQTLGTDRLEYRMQAFRNDRVKDALQLEFEREERVAQENFEHRHAKYRQFHWAEGQFRS